MRVVVPTETADGERRVAAVPETVGRFVAAGLAVSVQAGCGAAAWYPDEAYAAAGATVVPDVRDVLAGADVVCKVAPPTVEQVQAMPVGSVSISFLQPWAHPESIRALAARSVTSFSLDLVPRISRAQGMDALSSQALVAGYRAVLIAAEQLPKFLPLFMTAAGTVPPARVLVLGAGVAGLQAIATARRLGAVVEAYDVRAAAAEEVRSLGASFLELELDTQEGSGGYARVQSEEFLARQRELIAAHVRDADAVITTAAVPGRPAPLLVTGEMVHTMRAGSVIVDLAAEGGGNCALTKLGQTVLEHGVAVIGAQNVASSLPLHASALYARNVANLLALMVRDGQLSVDLSDEILAGCCVTRDGAIVNQAARELIETGGPT